MTNQLYLETRVWGGVERQSVIITVIRDIRRLSKQPRLLYAEELKNNIKIRKDRSSQ